MQQVVEYVRQSGDGVRAQQVADSLGIDKGKAAVYLKRASEARLIDRLERGLYGPIVLNNSYVNVYEVLDLDDSSNSSNTLSVSLDEISAVVA
jgi:predicted transcriptional regulator of viral defense system